MKDHVNFTIRLDRFQRFLFKNKMNRRLVFIITGIASTIWFLIRVIPKPTRASYPCMRVAAPIMSSFIIYILTLSGAVLAFKGAKRKLHQAKYMAAVSLFIVSVVSAVLYFIYDTKTTFAAKTYPGPHDGPNASMGTAFGIMPGRVAWAWNPAATNQNQTGATGFRNGTFCGEVSNTYDDFYFLPKNNNQNVINQMMSADIMSIANDSIEADAWNDLFVDFNTRKGRDSIGYQQGQIIFIKINMTGITAMNPYLSPEDTIWGTGCYGDYNPDLIRETGNPGFNSSNVMNTTPQSVYALIKSLVEQAGVPQSAIYVGDPMKNVYQDMYNYWKVDFPDINVLGNDTVGWFSGLTDVTTLGRVRVHASSVPLQFYSDQGLQMTSAINDNLYTIVQNANYTINLASFKAHARAGITLCAKNNHGSNTRSDASHLHQGLLCTVNNDQEDQPGYNTYYRVQVDDLANKYLGGNTMLFIVDALYDGEEGWEDVAPAKWTMNPFNNTFPSSIFMSQDPVAIESVCYDFLRTEFNNQNTYGVDRPNMYGTDDYLHQAADSANWPKTVGGRPFAGYAPNGDGVIIGSLGVHEHWNDSIDKQYSRNLDPIHGKGIELVLLQNPTTPSLQSTIKATETDFSIYPNPVHFTSMVHYSLSGNAKVEINIINIEGKTITSIVNQTQQSGEYQALLDASDIGTGAYYCEFVVDGKNICTKQIQVIK